MTERGRSADPRAERVRTRLRAAALALANERPVDGITVGDLVARAEVSRQVFYRHFRDRDDAVATAFSHAFAAARPRSRDARTHILDLFEFAARHPGLCHNVVSSTVHQHVLATYREALLDPCRQIADQGMAMLHTIAPLPADAVTRFLVGGLMEVLRSWMEDPHPTDLHARVRAALVTIDALLGGSPTPKGPLDG
ncbi:TetR/AcrR family transcriptional regulator [Mycobacterium sp. ITM-2016-00317]|uniref:TetR/AcrR family transcriptional regulator n=1 Tax=Mycobacterium sp. ITM-2016-00317 TaxID=2099694 RepID=UPI00287F75F1|nr:TetR/AcrR family transcriptional regulator [Mycobacterium sp. ITM-2016-00317]WNG85218.1 TetR/AcrR family transcriptional regulator [Mycobacterium sp. ITM-2016-00317]